MKSPTMIRNLLFASLASLSLGGCYYGDVYGASYADADCYSRYGDQYWVNDPYAYDDGYYGYDCYDAADYRSGFAQIGFGGGWYQQLYYPGYGLFLFDRYGRRHAMDHDYLTYWGGRRAWWKHHGHRYRDHDRRRGDGHHDGWRPGRGYGRGEATPPPPPGVNNGWSNGPAALPLPRERPRGDGWRGRPRGNYDGTNGGMPESASPPPPTVAPDAGAAPPPRMRRGGNGWGGNGGDRWTSPPAAPATVASPPPMAQPDQPRAPRIPRYSDPTIGNEGVTAVPVAPAPRPPRVAPPAAPASQPDLPRSAPPPRALPAPDVEPSPYRQPMSDTREGGIKED